MFNPNVVIKNIVQHPQMDTVISLIVRVLLAYIFIVAEWGLIALDAKAGYIK